MLNFPIELERFPRVISISILAGLMLGFPIGLTLKQADDLVEAPAESLICQKPLVQFSSKESEYVTLARKWVHASLECPFVSECKIEPTYMEDVMTDSARKQFENYFGAIGLEEHCTRIYAVHAEIFDTDKSRTGTMLRVVLNAPESLVPAHQTLFEIKLDKIGSKLKITDFHARPKHEAPLKEFVKLARARGLGEMKIEAIQLLADTSIFWSEDQLPNLRKAIELNPNLVLAHIKKSRIHALENDTQSALLELNEIVRIMPGYANALIARGVIKSKLKDNNGAIADFNSAIKNSPKNPCAYFYRGREFLEQCRYDEALADFSKAEKLDRKEAAYPGEAGKALFWKGKFKEAIKKFDQCLEIKGDSIGYSLNPHSFEVYLPGFFTYTDRCIYFERGLTYHWLKDRAKAKADYQKVLRTNYSQETKLDAITGLARIRIDKDSTESILADFDAQSRNFKDAPNFKESRSLLLVALKKKSCN
ncbi:MAG: hypothetical protein SFY67_17265 [Candidatus Melainabacteria bacterium]|nr:hypothetical protein [Candidatus Melainabacteria bacterium]